jgi:hypothetical protein
VERPDSGAEKGDKTMTTSPQGPVGGTGGGAFDDSDVPGSSPVTLITIAYDSHTIRGIQTTWANGKTAAHGTLSGDEIEVSQIAIKSEFNIISGVVGNYIGNDANGLRVLSLSINGSANIGPGPMPHSGPSFSIVAPDGYFFNALLGRSGLDLDALGVSMVASG